MLGLDIGSARIGVAIGDTETRLASPWGTVDARSEDRGFLALIDLIKKEGIERLVIGLPKLLRERSQATEQQKHIQEWAKRFQDAYTIDVIFEDETLTTALAARWQHEQSQKGKRDDLAALAILQSYLDRHGNVSS